MGNTPPEGSDIVVNMVDGYQCVIIPYKALGYSQYFIVAFLGFWLCGWFIGFTHAIEEISSGEGGLFLIFWLCGWSVGGIFACFTVYRLLRKAKPQILLFNRPYLTFDTGIPPMDLSKNDQNTRKFKQNIFTKRKKIEFDGREIESLKLRETNGGNRLTLDKGAERFDIAEMASEVEKEWLFELLKKNYRL